MISQKVKNQIAAIYEMYHRPEYLRMDPLVCVRSFTGRDQWEISGIISAMLAYGRVEIILRNLNTIFDRTERNVREFTINTTYSQKCKALKGIKHRFNDSKDIALAFECIKYALVEYDSLESCFVSGFEKEHKSIAAALDKFTQILQGFAFDIDKPQKSFGYLFSSPGRGSACKRMNMFLRWMVRCSDGIDLGIWKKIPASSLIIPVDTHVAGIARRFNLTKRKTVDWAMAEEITSNLRRIDPLDPVKFDFSLCRAGMMTTRMENHG